MASNRKLTVEDYLDFTKNSDHRLNNHQLRKVMSMHGFKWMEVPKNTLLDAVKTISLMDLRRSTLKDRSVSCGASLTMTGVIKDLNDLQWQECQVTSVISHGVDLTVTVNPKKSNGLGKKKPGKDDADDSIGITSTIDANSSTTALKFKSLEDIVKKTAEVKGDASINPTTGASVATADSQSGKTSKGLRKKSVEVAANYTGTTDAFGSDTISGKENRTLELKPVVAAHPQDSNNMHPRSKRAFQMPVKVSNYDTTVAAKGNAGLGKKKRLKGLEMKPVVLAPATDPSISTTGATT